MSDLGPKARWEAVRIGAAARRLPRCVLSLTLLYCAACTGGELDFADWTIPVTEGAPVFEYAAVPLEARTDRIIETEPDLVLGADLSDPQQVFYRASGAVPDPEGNIWVNDGGNLRVQVFDPSGSYVRTIGREGQGPGELERPLWPMITGGRFAVRAADRRLSLWTLAGGARARRAAEQAALGHDRSRRGLCSPL